MAPRWSALASGREGASKGGLFGPLKAERRAGFRTSWRQSDPIYCCFCKSLVACFWYERNDFLLNNIVNNYFWKILIKKVLLIWCLHLFYFTFKDFFRFKFNWILPTPGLIRSKKIFYCLDLRSFYDLFMSCKCGSVYSVNIALFGYAPGRYPITFNLWKSKKMFNLGRNWNKDFLCTI